MSAISIDKSKLIASTREVFDFHGGIHPDEMKSLSNQTPITTAPLAPQLILPLQQHIGKASKVIVEVGQQVLKGQKLANADGFISAALHAPTSGTIEDIREHAIAHPSGESDLCIFLIPDGKEQWCSLQACEDYQQLSASEIQHKVSEAGIAGMGGAGFPTVVKLHPPKQAKVDTYILNAAECEPYITSDDRLLRERADQVIAGMQIVASILKPENCLIGIEDNKPEAIAALRLATKDTLIQVCVVPTKYPSGGEKQLIKLLTNKEVPSGKIPADIGVVCQNVGTMAAIFKAVRFGEPLISRITTLTGQQIKQPGNVEVLFGTPINWLIEQYGYQASSKRGQKERLIMGGPMMGFTLEHPDTPIVKTTNCILAPNETELPLPPPAQACIRCGLCADACPAELLPQQLYWFSRAQELEKAEHHNLFDCIECGACSFVCPSAIPLVQYYRHTKGEIKKLNAEHQKSDQARERFEARQTRLDRDQAEKDAKRKARAEVAAKAQAAKKAATSAPRQEKVNTDLADKKTANIKETKTDAPQTIKAEDPTLELADLKETWDKAQAKLDKMYDALDDAKINHPENISKLTRAVEKNQMRVNQAKLLWTKTNNQKSTVDDSKAERVTLEPATTEIESKVDIPALELALDKATSKLSKLQNALDNAQPEQVEKLTRAVDKNKLRVNAADTELQQALAAQKSTNESALVDTVEAEPKVDISALELAIDKAVSKLSKLQNALDNAQPEQVEKLTRAVDKNKLRVEAAKAELQQALSKQVTVEPETTETEPEVDIPALELALDKAISKLSKLQNALDSAQPEQVEKLTRAVDKNKLRVEAAETALNQASASNNATTTKHNGEL